MKKIIKKTREERELEDKMNFVETKVKDTTFFYLACDMCGIGFFDEDIILQCADGHYRCPLTRGFFKKTCMNQIYGGEKETFVQYYKYDKYMPTNPEEEKSPFDYFKDLIDGNQELRALEIIWSQRIDEVLENFKDDWRLPKAIRNDTRDFIGKIIKHLKSN